MRLTPLDVHIAAEGDEEDYDEDGGEWEEGGGGAVLPSPRSRVAGALAGRVRKVQATAGTPKERPKLALGGRLAAGALGAALGATGGWSWGVCTPF
jgi:hypothetical protein